MLDRNASDVPVSSVEGEGPHGHDRVDVTLPLVARGVAVELDLVAIGVGGVEASAHAMVRRPAKEPVFREEGMGALYIGLPAAS